MNRSMLLYQALEAPDDVRRATVVCVHGYRADLDELAPLARELRPSFACVLPQAVRPVTPTYRAGWEADGYAWYMSQEVGRPEPATFGESLWQLEQFLHDVADRSGDAPCFLVGFDQGAVLALTMAGIAPESLAGVAALCGYLPEIRGWSLPVQDLNAFPVLLVQDLAPAAVPPPLVDRTIDELDRRAAKLDVRHVPGVQADPVRAAGELREWLHAQLAGLTRHDAERPLHSAVPSLTSDPGPAS